ncbi:MAG: hypothetical protein B7Z80_15570 [Rhodospirillales bacterium 20-64-7]|nr:MAG: hypothetical protein B7Z80_15570 [Rhodospirillales bacterium 20-64-7]
MSNKPTHTANVVREAPEGSDKKAQFFPIAAVWEHDDKDGYTIDLPPGVTVYGRIVIRRNKTKAD